MLLSLSITFTVVVCYQIHDFSLSGIGREHHMHGLIFVTWEKYLSERFGGNMLREYRSALSKQATVQTPLLASHVYDDATLVAGVGVASQLSEVSADVLLREYGRYFQMNGLTNHFCAYVVNQFQSGRDLLLAMSAVHAQLHHVHSGVTPPLFRYELPTDNPRGLILIYNSERQLCPVLMGAIEGAADRYGERAQVVEQTCMKKGASVCRFDVTFVPLRAQQERLRHTLEQTERRNWQNTMAQLVLSVLPKQGDGEGITLQELRVLLQQRNVPTRQLRPAVLLDAVLHLSYAGLATNSANQLGGQGDDLAHRRYWSASTNNGQNGFFLNQ